ncbi:TSC22 domain family protein 4 isoform X2 [Genypterus blacodes]|uniref:TSC22 domain family protein 4 isoform X2 n=1 Tax=Genypterus blacodes TaxID=154954 RepID=UPI003F769EFF
MCVRMSSGSGKKRSGFQITSVTSDFNAAPASQSASSIVLTVLQSAGSSHHGCSSQPTSPSLKRKHISHDASGQGTASSSRFRVVRLAGRGGSGRSDSYCRGRWTCTDVLDWQEGAGFKRMIDSMRHAHSLESLEMIGRGRGSDRANIHVRSQTASHLLPQPIRVREGTGLVVRSGPPSPTFQEPINVRLLDCKEPIGLRPLDSTPPLLSSRSRNNIPPPLRLNVDTTGRSVYRLSRSQPSSPPSGSFHPVQTSSGFRLDQTIFTLPGDNSGSIHGQIAIDNKIEQAMDLVKSHLMLAVREEVELLKEQIKELQEKNQQLERENHMLRALTHNPTTRNTHR